MLKAIHLFHTAMYYVVLDYRIARSRSLCMGCGEVIISTIYIVIALRRHFVGVQRIVICLIAIRSGELMSLIFVMMMMTLTKNIIYET